MYHKRLAQNYHTQRHSQLASVFVQACVSYLWHEVSQFFSRGHFTMSVGRSVRHSVHASVTRSVRNIIEIFSIYERSGVNYLVLVKMILDK